MSVKFLSDIEVKAGLRDSSGSLGASGQILSSTSGNVSWVTPTVNTVARDVQNQVKAGVAITKGQAVYVTGADGTNIIVGLASNTSEATSSKTLGLLNATVAINGTADVVQIGRLSGLNTIGATAGDPVWLGTNGNLIYGLLNKPYAPAHLVFIGIVTRVNANNGEIFINVQNGFELNEIHDVDLKTNVPINGDILGYDGTLWVNKTIAEWLGYTPANANGTTNYVSKFTGATTLGNSSIFDNGSAVGIFTSAPNFVTPGRGVLSLNGSSNSLMEFQAGGAFKSYLYQSGTNFEIYDTNAILFSVSGSERMRIDSSGNVGIGTTSPSGLLHLTGNSSSPITHIIENNGAVVDSSGTKLKFQFNGVETGFLYNFFDGGDFSTRLSSNGYLALQAGGAEKMRITSGGNVGIGTASPSYKLDVVGTGRFFSDLLTTGRFGVGNTNVNFRSTTVAFNGEVAAAAFTTFNNDQSLQEAARFSTADFVTGAVRIYPRVGLSNYNGITVADSAVVINQTTKPILLGVQDGSAVQFTATDIRIGTNNSEKMRITSNGNVGIGTASPNNSAILHLRSTTQGFLPPVMKTGERNGISSPAIGLMIFNKDDDAVQVYTGEGWRTLAWA